MKPKPSSSIDSRDPLRRRGRARSRAASSTSALPDCDETERLPCFATPAPAAAATSAAAVEMLNVLPPSPPVPAVSTRSSRFGCTGIDVRAHRLGRAGDLVRGLALQAQRDEEAADLGGRRLARHDRVHHPARLARGSGRCRRAAVRARPGSSRLEEVLRDVAPVRRQHRLGMELDAVDRQLAVPHGHHLAVGRRRRDLEARRARASRRASGSGPARKSSGRPAKMPAAVVRDDRRLAVHELARLPDLAAEDLHDRLVAEADAERRHPAGRAAAGSPACAPASSGRPGPGETTRCDGASVSASSGVISSLRRTTTSAPSSPNRCARL